MGRGEWGVGSGGGGGGTVNKGHLSSRGGRIISETFSGEPGDVLHSGGSSFVLFKFISANSC